LPAPDAQLLAVRWVNAAVNALVFGAWTAWEAHSLYKATLLPPPLPRAPTQAIDRPLDKQVK
ncbi:MAG TPA: hypothetical protein VLC52_00635, partial [Anaerolineae bacterium]|nr:hypothetical protein [Anaerolineae bacterium]